MKTLDEIAIETGTDKSSLQHNYCVKYERFLPFSRKAEIDILEIGVANGFSLKMWKQYYSNSKVTGIDLNPNCKDIDFDSGIEVFIGDATDENVLSSIKGNFDFIIDDGSHESCDMITTFEKMFHRVNSGGVYILEDTVCSYWTELNLRSSITIIEYLKNLVDSISFNGQKLTKKAPHLRSEKFIMEELENPTYFQKTIDGIMFLNSTVIIFKK